MSTKKILLKVILLGKSGTGKTSLMNRYVNNKFSNHYRATIGADFLTKEIDINNTKNILQIWDTAGQERFQSLGIAFYRGADGCIFVFDVTDRKSFEHLDHIIKEFKIYAKIENTIDFPFVLIGNKTDKEDFRVVFRREAEDWCKKNNIREYFECSACTAVNVAKAFETLAQHTLEFYDSTKSDQIVYLPPTEVISLEDPGILSRCCGL